MYSATYRYHQTREEWPGCESQNLGRKRYENNATKQDACQVKRKFSKFHLHLSYLYCSSYYNTCSKIICFTFFHISLRRISSIFPNGSVYSSSGGTQLCHRMKYYSNYPLQVAIHKSIQIFQINLLDRIK